MAVQVLKLGSLLLLAKLVSGAIIPDPMCVFRRQGRDFVYTDMECNLPMICPSAQPTYLISDETCVSDQSLVTQCSLQLVQMGSTPTDTITAVAIQNGSLSVLTAPSSVQVVYYNQTGSPDNCSIASLEVYRGEDTSIVISHRGFTIGDNHTIQVEEGQLAYDRADYDGELYRMNVSCDDVMTTEGCLFFKLLSDQAATIGNAKFNCTVPGTENGTIIDDQCVLSTTISTTASENTSLTTNDHQTTTVTVDTTTITPIRTASSITEGCTCGGVEYQPLTIGLGVTSGVFILVIISLSVVVIYMATKLRRITRAQRLLEKIQRQGGGIAKPGTELIFANPTSNEPLYEDVERRRDVINQNYSLDELEDNPAYGKTVQQTRIT